MKPTKTEEKCITFLSKVVQLMYDLLGTKTTGSAFLLNGFFAASVSLIAAFTFAYINDKHSDMNLVLYGTVSIVLLVNVVLMCFIGAHFAFNLILYNTSNVMSNASLQPNPNKYSSWIVVCRMSIPCFILVCFNQFSNSGSWGVVLVSTLCFLGVTIAMYTLLCRQTNT